VAPNTHVPAEQLEADIRDGTIDTVVVAFADHHAEFEWHSFNATVTDWERHRYFERI
jgi:glutamine synthetase